MAGALKTYYVVKTNEIVQVWKGIFGIRDLTKIRCGIRENEKYLDGIRDLPAPWEPGSAKIWVREEGFFACLSGMWKIVMTRIIVLAKKGGWCLISHV